MEKSLQICKNCQDSYRKRAQIIFFTFSEMHFYYLWRKWLRSAQCKMLHLFFFKCFGKIYIGKIWIFIFQIIQLCPSLLVLSNAPPCLGCLQIVSHEGRNSKTHRFEESLRYAHVLVPQLIQAVSQSINIQLASTLCLALFYIM